MFFFILIVFKLLFCRHLIKSNQINQSDDSHDTDIIECFEDEHNYYLVMENNNNNLAKLVQIAHQYINDERLTLNEWKITVNNITWYVFIYLLYYTV